MTINEVTTYKIDFIHKITWGSETYYVYISVTKYTLLYKCN